VVFVIVARRVMIVLCLIDLARQRGHSSFDLLDEVPNTRKSTSLTTADSKHAVESSVDDAITSSKLTVVKSEKATPMKAPPLLGVLPPSSETKQATAVTKPKARGRVEEETSDTPVSARSRRTRRSAQEDDDGTRKRAKTGTIESTQEDGKGKRGAVWTKAQIDKLQLYECARDAARLNARLSLRKVFSGKSLIGHAAAVTELKGFTQREISNKLKSLSRAPSADGDANDDDDDHDDDDDDHEADESFHD